MGEGVAMTFEGAIITEQRVTFGIVVVKSHVLNDHAEANNLISSFQGVMRVAPVVLMAQDSKGVPTYYGRKDIVAFLAHIDMRRIPWKRYGLTA
jgi:hypothetical protein